MAWDPKLYLGYADHRTRPAGELLARVPAERPKRVIDLGCGPGNSTALLAQRWPDADLEGLDSSPEMLAEAAKSGVKARWVQADLASWSADAPYDVIFSNATLQWVPAHDTLLPRLMTSLAKGGVFTFQVPCNFEQPSHTILGDLAQLPRWNARLSGVRDWHTVLPLDAYYAILEPHAASIDIWETEYLQVLDGDDAVYRWTSATGARPFINALEGAEREAFVAEYKKRLNDAYPRRASGKTLFPFQRRFVVAAR
jgi:trans-aconitate 2-methyltransferase